MDKMFDITDRDNIISYLKESGEMIHKSNLNSCGGFPDAELLAVSKISHAISLRILKKNGIEADVSLCSIERPKENDIEVMQEIVMDCVMDYGNCVEGYFHSVYENAGWNIDRFPISSEIECEDGLYEESERQYAVETTYADYIMKYPEAVKHEDTIKEAIAFCYEDECNYCQEVIFIHNPNAEKVLLYEKEHPEITNDALVKQFHELLKMALLPFPSGDTEEVGVSLMNGRVRNEFFYYSDSQCYCCDGYSGNPLYIAAAGLMSVVMKEIVQQYHIAGFD